jgi:hypothetical protein
MPASSENGPCPGSQLVVVAPPLCSAVSRSYQDVQERCYWQAGRPFSASPTSNVPWGSMASVKIRKSPRVTRGELSHWHRGTLSGNREPQRGRASRWSGHSGGSHGSWISEISYNRAAEVTVGKALSLPARALSAKAQVVPWQPRPQPPGQEGPAIAAAPRVVPSWLRRRTRRRSPPRWRRTSGRS